MNAGDDEYFTKINERKHAMKCLILMLISID
jgi:hypothetical protein